MTAQPDAPRPAGVCLDCGQPLHGRFCSRCGQEAVTDPSLGHWLRDLAADILNLDSRFWGTLRLLLFSPGTLSVDYRAGRRTRWIPPLRLYLVSSLLFFAAVEVAPVPVARLTGSEDVAAGSAPEVTIRSGRGMAARMDRAAARPELLNRLWIRGITWTMFALIPAFAALLMLAWRRPRQPYVYHLVFALHVHSVAFLLFALAMALTYPLARYDERAMQGPVRLALLIASVYFIAAALRFYGRGIFATVLRTAFVAVAYGAVLAAAALLVLGGVVVLLS